MKKNYYKLVRDKIPEIIRKDNGKPEVSILNKDSYLSELVFKLLEESIEVIKSRHDKAELMKEIGDVYEVIDAIIECSALDKDEIIKLKELRKEKRGGFKDRIYLKYVEEVES